ncbi:hypothetical protein HYPBUDRAFT_109758 [Hyphopichia burtonii NRRL Y-1933]|uniref:RNA polymerase II-associated protein RBA50 n=1 Tax=Hyphopichia burtonii NRRL Y-1933 TaxID=984485 RepID=A0A1E4RJ02_9ASCO|nr:hypothetical protein HYPBUDRAFT_109758 [Hyphopichia burtonii NRRL Y-1933]ODV67075.1 hypothetical protein HYPBUDRAFT_109758 [Hyphopichia burtonii NRRL Y-1933]
MDLIGEIVEREVEAPAPPMSSKNNGFPDPGKLKEKRVSRWKQKAQEQKKQERREPAKENIQPEPKTELSEAEKIHQENMKKISDLTEEEISQEREELLNGLDPSLIKSLLARTEKRIKEEACCDGHDHGHDHAEGYGGWIGGGKDGSSVSHLDSNDVDKALGVSKISLADDIKEEASTEGDKSKTNKKDKTVRFNEVATVKYEDLDDDIELDEDGWEDVEDINDLIPNMPKGEENQIAHDDYQLLSEKEEAEEDGAPLKVHFPKPKSNNNDDLDLNDPEFFNKLHEKYYPDLPKETNKLSWMTEPMPTNYTSTYESISDMRFDFKGNLIELDDSGDKQSEIPTYMGLHHHSDNPHLAGYSLPELSRLSRSVVPGQRCFSLQMLGRILHKLGLHKYNFMPISDKKEDQEFNNNLKSLVTDFEDLIWNLIGELRILESIQEAADESKTKNLSVRNYAIEALWLWKQAGGKQPSKTISEEEIIAREVQN